MRLDGRIWKDGKFWLIEVPMLDVMTQGHSRKDALYMIADAVESLINKRGFKLEVRDRGGERVEVGSADDATLVSFLLRRQRQKHGLTLDEMAKRLGQRSRNAYARYEQGVAVPTVAKLSELLRAVGPGNDLVISSTEIDEAAE